MKVDISSLIRKVFHYVSMGFTSCHMQWSPLVEKVGQILTEYQAAYICDLLSENPALPANIEFDFEALLSVQVVFQLNSDYYTMVLQGACTVSY